MSCSVSSVNTLEEAKVAKNCLYIQMPVQEVNLHIAVRLVHALKVILVWNPAV